MRRTLTVLFFIGAAGIAGCANHAPKGMDASQRRPNDCVGKLELYQGRWHACTPLETSESVVTTYRKITFFFKVDHGAQNGAIYEDTQDSYVKPGERCSGPLPVGMIGGYVKRCEVYGAALK